MKADRDEGGREEGSELHGDRLKECISWLDLSSSSDCIFTEWKLKALYIGIFLRRRSQTAKLFSYVRRRKSFRRVVTMLARGIL